MTDYKTQIKELRQIVPIPMSEALQMLKENNGDVKLCVEKFKAAAIAKICSETSCDKYTAEKYYEREKYDLNRTVSMIREDMYDLNYKPIGGITAEGLGKVRLWISFVEEKDFATALDYNCLLYTSDAAVIRALLLIPSLKHFGIAVQQARKIKDSIFKGYSDDLSIDEFVRRNVRLDDHLEFQKLYKSVTLSIIPLKEELNRHRRNMK